MLTAQFSISGSMWLLSNDRAVWLVALPAFCLTISIKYVFIIIKRLLLHGRQAWTRRQPQPPGRNHDDEEPLLGSDSSPVVDRNTHGIREIMSNVRRMLNPTSVYATFEVVLSLLVLFGMLSMTFTSQWAETSNRNALWHSDTCGVWVFDRKHAGNEEATRADRNMRAKEERAGDYAKYCYSGASLTLPARCNFFIQPKIEILKNYTYACPFSGTDLCIEGTQTVTFYTNLVDAIDIGINTKVRYKWRRSATCTALNVGEPYVRNETVGGEDGFSYYYGSTLGSNYTFRTSGDPFKWTVPTYDVR
jgi:hypothetical protein